MKIPDSFHYAFRAEEQIAEAIERAAGTRLHGICRDNNWLFDGRVKSEESALAKLQMGGLGALSDMDDLYAATVVVPTRKEIHPATEAIRAVYLDAVLRERPRADPQKFRYDDAHLYATLGSTAPGIEPVVQGRTFEIQVRTGLQFSWWKATHRVLYKGDVRDWRLERVASQVRGTLELIDGVLADLPAAAELLKEQDEDADARFSLIAGWLDRWNSDQRPEDRKRYVDTVEGWLADADVGVAELETRLDTDRGRDLVANEKITPAQVVQVLAAEVVGASRLVRKGRRLLVTSELAEAAPMMAELAAGSKVQL